MNHEQFKIALVTGATSGIGEALARLFAEKGISLVLTGRNEKKLESLKAELSQKVNVITFVADLANSDQRKQVVAKIHELCPDLVINNAGFGLHGDAFWYSTDQQLEILEVDGKAVLEFTLEAAKSMKEKGKSGVIVNISSVAGFQAMPRFSVYAATKAFVNSMSLSLNEEFRSYGIKVLAACPGVVATDFARRASGGKFKDTIPMTMTIDFAVKEIWNQIESGKGIHAFDWRYRVLTTLSQFMPYKVIFWISEKGFRIRTKK